MAVAILSQRKKGLPHGKLAHSSIGTNSNKAFYNLFLYLHVCLVTPGPVFFFSAKQFKPEM